MESKVKALYFSATGTTRKIVSEIADTISAHFGREIQPMDFTSPEARRQMPAIDPGDLVIVGVPVYAGRVPNVLLKYLNSLAGNGATAVAVVVYGNRNYDDALIELTDILATTGFRVVGGGAFVGEHSFSRTLAKERPDERDMKVAKAFAQQLAKKIAKGQAEAVSVKGNKPYRGYYIPKNSQGEPVDIRKVTPKTSDMCTDCGLCVGKCPMGSIDPKNPRQMIGICIKCGACIKICPVQAKYYDDDHYLHHKRELEIQFANRREPELFL